MDYGQKSIYSRVNSNRKVTDSTGRYAMSKIGDYYVMVKLSRFEFNKVEEKHRLLVAATNEDRLLAHWMGFAYGNA